MILRTAAYSAQNTAMTTLLYVALAQYLNGSDPASIIEECHRGGAEVVVFPQMYSNGYARFDPEDSVAEEHWLNGAQEFGRRVHWTIQEGSKGSSNPRRRNFLGGC